MKKQIVDISEKDINALFVKTSDVKSILRSARASFFDTAILNKAVSEMIANGTSLNINAFWNVAKCGDRKANADKNHVCFYVSRAVKMEMLRQKDKLDLLQENFNSPESSKILREKLNNKAFKISENILNDDTKALLLNVDFKNAYK